MGKRNRIEPGFVLAALLAINAVLGWFLAPDFGRTPDETIESVRATAALRAYTPGSLGKYSDNEIDPISRFYGTAISSLAYGFEALLIEPTGAEPGVLVHYAYFLIFLAGVAGLYFLCRKFTGAWAALGAAALFATQPYLFGHAFNNPKDIPLLVVFLGAVTAGLYMIDAVADRRQEGEQVERERFDLRSAWTNLPDDDRKAIVRVQLAWLVVLAVWIAALLMVPVVVRYFYQAPGDTWAGQVFTVVVDGEPLPDEELYISKASILIDRIVVVLGSATVFGVAGVIFWRFDPARRAVVAWVNQILRQFRIPVLVRALVDWRIVLAGMLWGLAIATRSVALFAGGIVGLYGVLIIGKRAVRPLLVYALWAGATAYLAFPQLWIGGFSRLIDGLTVLSNFPWPGNVYYQGEIFAASMLPRSYLPFFLVVKYTLPVLVLAVVGMWAAVRQWREAGKRWQAGLAVCLLWSALPVLHAVITRPVLYDSARQYLFVLPPMFLLGGLGLAQVFVWASPRWLQFGLTAAILAPGMIALIGLHPYQYVYYNPLVGGVSGAAEEYAVDYWSVSATEAIRYVNREAPDGAQVVFTNVGTLQAAEFYAREDLKLVKANDSVDPESAEYWIITGTGINDGLLFDPAAERVFTIERQGVILGAVVVIRGDPNGE